MSVIGKIYKISCSGTDKVYIGSTINRSLPTRFSNHLNEYKRWNQGIRKGSYSLFKYFQEYGLENCSIHLVENCVCLDRSELRGREDYWCSQFNCINLNVARKYKTRDITCKCGSILSKTSYKKHIKSQKHQNYLKSETKTA
jgi:hypothetical protein